MYNKLVIKNYKSILSDEISLGRFNVFIGENGAGKTNILEALAMVSASANKDLNVEGLFNRGVRVTKPSLTFSSFLGKEQVDEIFVELFVENKDEEIDSVSSKFTAQDPNDIYSKWNDETDSTFYFSKAKNQELEHFIIENYKDHLSTDFQHEFIKLIEKSFNTKTKSVKIKDFIIYNLSSQALRGIENNSKKQPLGIYGEGLDILLANFNKQEREELKEFSYLISWLEDIIIDEKDTLKYKGHKLGRSSSELYFRDEFMRKKNNVFSAENANEGALYMLFYLALFISEKTPNFFAIDNLETALNPKLCRTITKTLAQLAQKHDKQAIVTTHNPAILDGLNLHDDDQRLFVVYRNDDGHTQTKRIKLKPKVEGKSYKLSELWMRGKLGGLPNNFL